MSKVTIFSKSVLKTKKNDNKLKLLSRVFGRIIKNNRKRFFFCSVFAIFTAMVNFSIGINARNLIFNSGKTFAEATIEEINKEPEIQIPIATIEKILTEKVNQEEKEKINKAIQEISKSKTSLSKQEAEEIIKEAAKSGDKIWNKKNYKFAFNFFGLKLFKKENLDI